MDKIPDISQEKLQDITVMTHIIYRLCRLKMILNYFSNCPLTNFAFLTAPFPIHYKQQLQLNVEQVESAI